MKNLIKYISGVFMLLASGAVFAASSVVWTFNLPSTAVASQSPPYPTVATLTLTQVGDNVQFLLDPNEASPGVNGSGHSPATSFIDQIDLVYKGAALSSSSVVWNSGALIDSFSYNTNPHNMDSSYTTQDQYLEFIFTKNAPKNGDPDQRFSFDDTSTWTINGVILADFTDTFATSNSHPSPTYGVISVAPYDLTNPHPTPSNWVTGVSPVPEPQTYAMLLAGLGLIGITAFLSKNQMDFV